MAMSPDIRSRYVFLDTLFEIEHLIGLRAKMIDSHVDVCSVGKIILQKTDSLISSNVVVSKSDCLINIERLAEASLKIGEGTLILEDGMVHNLNKIECHLFGGDVFQKIMELKLDNLVEAAASDNGRDRFHLCERLARLARKMMDFKIHPVISAKCCILIDPSESGASRDACRASDSSDDVVLTPDDSNSVSSKVSTDERSFEEQIRELQNSLQKADRDKLAMSAELINRDGRVKQLETELAGCKSSHHESLNTEVSELRALLAAAEMQKKCRVITMEEYTSDIALLRDDNARLREELDTARKTIDQYPRPPRRSKTSSVSTPDTNAKVNEQEAEVSSACDQYPFHPAEKAVPIKSDRPWPTRYGNLPKRTLTRGRDSAGVRAYTFGKPNEDHQWSGFDRPTTFAAKEVPKLGKPGQWEDQSASDCNTWDY